MELGQIYRREDHGDHWKVIRLYGMSLGGLEQVDLQQIEEPDNYIRVIYTIPYTQPQIGWILVRNAPVVE